VEAGDAGRRARGRERGPRARQHDSPVAV